MMTTHAIMTIIIIIVIIITNLTRHYYFLKSGSVLTGTAYNSLPEHKIKDEMFTRAQNIISKIEAEQVQI
jgi:hypothetical protein